MVQMSYINKVEYNDKIVIDENKMQSIVQLLYTTALVCMSDYISSTHEITKKYFYHPFQPTNMFYTMYKLSYMQFLLISNLNHQFLPMKKRKGSETI